METRHDECIGQLLQALKHSDKLHLRETATLLGVSEVTIRRDLNNYSAPAVLLGDYIILEPRGANYYLISDRESHLVDEKRYAAQQAASPVQVHQVIFFDCGTTTPWIIEVIDDELPFTTIYYSLNTSLVLQEEPQCRITLCGGELHASNAISKPLDFQETLNNLYPDIVFYPATGVHTERGATCFDLEELLIKYWVMSVAQYHVLVVDHSKFDRMRPARMRELKRFDIIISDSRPDKMSVEYAKTQRITLKY